MTNMGKPTLPGEILREDVMKPPGLTLMEAANRLGVNRKTLSALLNCGASMSPEMAVRVGNRRGITAVRASINTKADFFSRRQFPLSHDLAFLPNFLPLL